MTAVVATALILAACGEAESGGGTGNTVASLSEGAAEPSSEDSGSRRPDADELEAPEDPNDAFALYEACLSEQGIGGVGSFVAGGGSTGGIAIDGGPITSIDPQGSPSSEDLDLDAFEAANEACEGHLASVVGDLDLSPEQEAAMADAQLEFADCMAERGIEIPEFEAGSGAGAIAVVELGEVGEDGQPSSGVLDDDFNFEAFEEAASECDTAFDALERVDP